MQMAAMANGPAPTDHPVVCCPDAGILPPYMAARTEAPAATGASIMLSGIVPGFRSATPK